MTNADKFKSLFGLYATELWAMPEKNFLKWLNSEVSNCSEFPNNSDCIDRQDAIKYFTKLWNCIGTISDREEWEDVCITTVNEIKSAEPPSKCVAKVMINKEDIEELVTEKVEELKEILESQSERKRGKWVDDGTELGCCCSECGVTLDDYFYGELYEVRLSKMPNFCPNCGSYNGGEEE